MKSNFYKEIKIEVPISIDDHEFEIIIKNSHEPWHKIADKTLSIFTWHDRMPKEDKIKIIEVLQRHISIIQKHM